MSEQCEEYRFNSVDTYHLIVDLAEECIWILDTNDKLVFTNKKLQSVLGYSKEELQCRDVFDIFADDDHESVKKALERRHQGVRETYTARLKRKDSSLTWVAVAAAPILDKQGKYNGAVSLASDISAVKKGEEALKKEKSLANMYLDLMAHDINNLNQVAIGNLEIAIEKLQTKPSDSHEILNYLEKSLNTMSQQTALIRNVKTVQQLKAEQLRYDNVDLGDVVATAAKDCPKVPGRDVTIDFEKPDHCVVRTNGLLKEVFANLIGNSVKHSSRPVHIWITVDSAIDHGKKYYEVTVADDGPGIPDDMKGQLFRRFKGEGARASGHGLGLYLVKMIVEDCGGRVRVEDRVPGDYRKGTTFVVLLPAAS